MQQDPYHHHQQQQQQQQQQQAYYQHTMNNNNHVHHNNNNNNPENNGPRAKCDQVIFEALSKAAEIIVNGRSAGTTANGVTSSNGLVARAGGGGGMYNGGTHHHPSNTNNSTGVTSSSRFNLMVPEIASVRQILQRWRRALHVPLRLDLYTQTNPHERKLLERWCLEYVPAQAHDDPFYERECKSSDPIVQLRHVCKKIVIWLRNLYCSSRLLPAQAFQHPSCAAHLQIGFSIYMAQATDDVTNLVEQHQFDCQKQPSTVLTPYGELVWRVYYARKAEIQPHLPHHHPVRAPLFSRPQKTSAPMAIPRNSSTPAGMDQLQQQQLSTTPTTQPPMVPQSAPAHITSGGGQHFLQTGHHNNNNAAHPTNHPDNNNAFQYGLLDAHHPRNTYHNNRHRTSLTHHRSNSGSNNNNAMPHAQFLQRRNTSLGIDEAAITKVLRDDDNDDDELMQHPEKLLSGLSLALMSPQKDNADNGNGDATATTEQVEKRRAALHHAPPHLMEAQQQQVPPKQQSDNSKRNQPTHAGEYGYAYNNHIAWQQIRPSTTVPIALPQTSTSNNNNSYSPSRATRLSSSPSPLAGTPPTGGAFLRMAVGSAGSAAAAAGGGMLIPPRNSSANNNTTTTPGGCAPPFPNRPIGFIHEPPSLLQDPAQQLHTFPQQPQQQQLEAPLQQQAQSKKQPHDATNTTSQMAPPMTSLDLLHSSPFQQGASVLSSFSAVAGGPTSTTTGHTHAHHNPPQGSLSFMRASASAIVAAVAQPEDDGLLLDYDDMPFAVDLDSTDAASTTTKHSTMESSPFADHHSIMSSSSAVATFAQKCAPAQHRLKLFETLEASSSLAADNKSVFAASTELTNQLAEFRTFGASLSLAHHPGSSGGGSGSDDTGSSMTPIPLRTS